MSVTVPANSRGPILELALPAMALSLDIILRNKTTGKQLTVNLPAKWNGDDLVLDFYRRTIRDQTGTDRSDLLDTKDHELWTSNQSFLGGVANDVEIESVRAATAAGPAAAGTVADDASVGTIAWSNPTFAKAEDASYALAAVTGGASGLSHYLKATNFPLSIPAGATIEGVLLSVKRRKSGTLATVKDSRVRLVKGGVIQAASEKSVGSNWPAIGGITTFGGSTDLWGVALVAADIGAGFGVAIAPELVSSPGFNCDAEVDYISLAVYYHDPAITATLRWEQGYY